MLYDIQINSPNAINVVYILCASLTYFHKNFLIDEQLADLLHYDVTKLN